MISQIYTGHAPVFLCVNSTGSHTMLLCHGDTEIGLPAAISAGDQKFCSSGFIQRDLYIYEYRNR